MMTMQAQATLCPICRTSNRSDARFCQKCGANIVLDNSYRVVRVVKEGGQGTVYEALDTFGRRYALKELIDRFDKQKDRDEAIGRFLAEAKILRGLRHPRIPQVHRSFLHGGRYYVAMDFVNGEDLEEVVARQGRFDEAQVLTWADQITDVLSYLHGQGVIYRDMKPSNIMVERDSGAVKLVDFGIAKIFQPAQRGTLIGTPGYAPPEQYQGLATPQSDVYALGATLHHLLTGRDPRDHAPFSFPPLLELAPGVSPETAEAIERALLMEPGARWPDAASLRAALPLDRGSRRRPQATTALRQSAPVEPALSAPRLGTPALPKSATMPPTAPPAQRQPPLMPRPQATPPRRSRGFHPGSFLIALMLVLGMVYLVEPGVQGWVNGLVFESPAATPTKQPYLPQDFEVVLEVKVASGATPDQIYQAFSLAYEQAAKDQLDPSAQVNRNTPPAYLGDPVMIGSEGSMRIYQATLRGRVSAPVSR